MLARIFCLIILWFQFCSSSSCHLIFVPFGLHLLWQLKDVILLTPVLLFLLVFSPHFHSPAFTTIPSLRATTSAWVRNGQRKIIKSILLYSALCFSYIYQDRVCGCMHKAPAYTAAPAAERSWKRLVSERRLLLPRHMVNPGIAAAWRLSQTGHTRETGNHTLEWNPLHLVTKSWTQALASEDGKERGAQLILSANVKLTTDTKDFPCPEKRPLGWIILDWKMKD